MHMTHRAQGKRLKYLCVEGNVVIAYGQKFLTPTWSAAAECNWASSALDTRGTRREDENSRTRGRRLLFADSQRPRSVIKHSS